MERLRRISQVDEVEQALGSHGRKIAKVIFLDLSLEEAVKRISIRFLCLNCKKPFIKQEQRERAWFVMSVVEK